MVRVCGPGGNSNDAKVKNNGRLSHERISAAGVVLAESINYDEDVMCEDCGATQCGYPDECTVDAIYREENTA